MRFMDSPYRGAIKKIIPKFMTPKTCSPPPLQSSAKPRKDSPSPRSEKEEELTQIGISVMPPPSSPHLHPRRVSFSSTVLRSELEEAFRKFDANGDGRISPAEVCTLLRSMGDHVSEEEAANMVKEADKNGDGFVDVHEFIDLMTMPSPPPSPSRRPVHGEIAVEEEEEEEEELQSAFRLFDVDKNGLISAEELQDMLISLGETESSLQDCRRMIHAVDRNHDGFVDYQEFKAMMIITTCA